MKSKLAKVVPILALIALIGMFYLQWHAMQAPGAKERLAKTITETPDYIFWPFWFGIMAVGLCVVYWATIGHRRWAKKATETTFQYAKRIATSLWCVSSDVLVESDFIGLRLRHYSWPSRSFVLPVRIGHPDVGLFKQLQKDDVVEFEAVNDPHVEFALEHELCRYLRIKSVTS